MSDLSIVKNNLLRSEFLRAADLIAQTQVTMFIDRPVPDRAGMVTELQQRLLESGNAHDEAIQIDAMRQLLNDTLSRFNDPYANYISPRQLKAYYSRRGGNLTGIGIKFRAVSDEYPLVLGVLLDGPLEGSDLRPGHQIIAIDGLDQKGAISRDVGKLLKGEEGTEVEILLRDDSAEDYRVFATRTRVKLSYVRSELLPSKVGYIKVSRFGGKTHETVRLHVQRLIDQNAAGFVLDLRDNSGGSTRAARSIVSIFTDQKDIYCQQFKSGAVRKLPRHGTKLTLLPLNVLVNERSMSSSEIVAGALQDYGRATVIGAPTYGKGLIQKVFNMKDPLGGAVRTTIATYATPSHTLIHGVGVTPDLYVATAPKHLFAETGSLNISDKARAYRRQLLENDLRKTLSKDAADKLISLRDEQLITAVAHLQTKL